MIEDTLTTSLLMADFFSKFLLQRRETLGHQSWRAVSVVPVARSTSDRQ